MNCAAAANVFRNKHKHFVIATDFSFSFHLDFLLILWICELTENLVLPSKTIETLSRRTCSCSLLLSSAAAGFPLRPKAPLKNHCFRNIKPHVQLAAWRRLVAPPAGPYCSLRPATPHQCLLVCGALPYMEWLQLGAS